jgi:hypothetical protein
MSTATIYAHRLDAPNDERTGVLGGGEPGAPDTWRFSLDVATAWERRRRDARLPAARRGIVLLRSAMVMSPDRGGVFDVLLGSRGRASAGRRGRRAPVRVVDAPRRPLGRGAVAHRARGRRGPGEPRAPSPLPQARSSRAARGVGDPGPGCPATRWMLELGALACARRPS